MGDITKTDAERIMSLGQKLGFQMQRGYGYAAGLKTASSVAYMLSIDSQGVELAAYANNRRRVRPIATWPFDRPTDHVLTEIRRLVETDAARSLAAA